MVVALVVVLVMGSTGDGTNSSSLRSSSGQAQHGSDGMITGAIENEANSPWSSSSSSTTPSGSDPVGDALEEIDSELIQAEEEELTKVETELDTDIMSAADSVRNKVSSFLNGKTTGTGSSAAPLLSAEEIEEMTEYMTEELEVETSETIELEASEIVDEAMEFVEEEVDIEEAEGISEAEIVRDIYNQEPEEVAAVHKRIHNVGEQLHGSLRQQALEIEKQILEQRLSEKLGKQVKLMIVEDEIADIDGLLDGLTTLTGPTSTTTTSSSSTLSDNSVSSSSYGSTSGSGSSYTASSSISSPSYGSDSSSLGGSTTTTSISSSSYGVESSTTSNANPASSTYGVDGDDMYKIANQESQGAAPPSSQTFGTNENGELLDDDDDDDDTTNNKEFGDNSVEVRVDTSEGDDWM